MGESKLLVTIAGATATGKTDVAISLAKHFNTEILSFDSRQCYREMDIGVARPNVHQLAMVNHYFIASHSIHGPVNAKAFEKYALETLNTLFENHSVVIAVGGTGLYLKALLEGLDEMPEVPEALRASLRANFQEKGMDWLTKALVKQDQLYAKMGEMENPHRMLRALEISQFSGRSIFEFQQQKAVPRTFSHLSLGIGVEKVRLHAQIEQRVQMMKVAGLEAEVEGLKPYLNTQPLKTVGYQEWLPYFDGKISKEQVFEQIFVHTRQYAKRQNTWFKKQGVSHWFSPEAIASMIELIHKQGEKPSSPGAKPFS